MALLSRGRGVLRKLAVVYNREMIRIGPGLNAGLTEIDKVPPGLTTIYMRQILFLLLVFHFMNKS